SRGSLRSRPVTPRGPPPCPTRRSADLPSFDTSTPPVALRGVPKLSTPEVTGNHGCRGSSRWVPSEGGTATASARAFIPVAVTPRSEEHTSELQSRFDLACPPRLANTNT